MDLEAQVRVVRALEKTAAKVVVLQHQADMWKSIALCLSSLSLALLFALVLHVCRH